MSTPALGRLGGGGNAYVPHRLGREQRSRAGGEDGNRRFAGHEHDIVARSVQGELVADFDDLSRWSSPTGLGALLLQQAASWACGSHGPRWRAISPVFKSLVMARQGTGPNSFSPPVVFPTKSEL